MPKRSPSLPSRLLSSVLACALAACTQAPGSGESAPAAVQARPTPAAARAPDPDAPPAGGALTVHANGVGPVRFGANAQALRDAWQGTLGGELPDEPHGCYYLYPQPHAPDRVDLAFMFEDARFVRADVDTPDLVAPGGGRIGMDSRKIARLYAGRIEAAPHAYVPGAHYLRVTGDTPGVLVFETDEAGRVTRWRSGLAPQVDYVEGCA